MEACLALPATNIIMLLIISFFISSKLDPTGLPAFPHDNLE